jgi:transketolase
MRDTFVKTLEALTSQDSRIMLVTGDLGFGVLTNFAKQYPDNYLNAGVAEQNMTGLAVGMALEGHIVFTYSIANFPILRCLEQIRNDACYHKANVKIVSIGGGFSYGSLGISHHATEDISIMRALPNMTVVVPGDLWEVQEATKAMVNTPGACYLRLDKSHAVTTPDPDEAFELGRARCLIEGKDLTLVCAGGILEVGLKVAETLKNSNINCRVLSMHTLKPLDTESIRRAVQETGGIVTLEEHTVEGGLGGSVAEYCLESGEVPKIFRRMGLRSGFSSIVGTQNYLRERYEMDDKSISSWIIQRLNS